MGLIKADPGQIEQIIMNLAVDARDAMLRGGKLLIETANIAISGRDTGRHLVLETGSYLQLAISDTGIGMDEETREKILFETFFTAKDKTKGKALGLASIYGIVKQSNGYIAICSEPGHGTTIKIYLPRHTEEELPTEEIKAISFASLKGSETILVVEDEELCVILLLKCIIFGDIASTIISIIN